MVTIAKQQWFKRTRVKTKQKKIDFSKFSTKIQISSNALWIIIIIIIFLYWLYLIFQKTLLKPENVIRNVEISSETLTEYDSPYIIKDIKNYIIGENVYLLKMFHKDDLLQEIQSVYPIVKGITLNKSNSYTAVVEIEYFIPDLIVKSQDKRFGYYKNYNFVIFSGNTIWSSTTTFELPIYSSGIDSIYGLFFDRDILEFKEQIEFIQDVVPDVVRTVYLPGGEKILIVLWDNKRIYLNILSDIPEQIQKLLRVQQYYKDYDKISTIDLWSLKGWEIIVR